VMSQDTGAAGPYRRRIDTLWVGHDPGISKFDVFHLGQFVRPRSRHYLLEVWLTLPLGPPS